MSTEENKALVRRYFAAIAEAWPARNWALLDELIAPDVAYQDPNAPFRGREELEQLLAAYRTAFPDAAHVVIEDMVAEGDNVATLWSSTSPHEGEFLGIPATGKTMRVSVLSLYRVQDGKVVEMRDRFDVLSLLQQLGVSSLPSATSVAK